MSEDYKVGYRKPPAHTRFKPGQSGNPKGRRKGAVNADTLIERELAKKVTVRENGVAKTITKREVLATSTVNNAISRPGKDREFLLRREAERAAAAPSEEAVATPDEAQIIDAFLQRRLEDLIEREIAAGRLARVTPPEGEEE
jgi:hypothetical protein